MSQSLESVVRGLVGQINGVTSLVLRGRVAGAVAGLDEEAEVHVAVMVSAVVRRRAPMRVLGL